MLANVQCSHALNTEAKLLMEKISESGVKEKEAVVDGRDRLREVSINELKRGPSRNSLFSETDPTTEQ